MDLPWEMHRATIRSLYLEKDMTRKEVMDEMERKYQFRATAGQYERQFKKSDFRKNLTAEQWQFVSRRVEKRKRDGKDTDIKIDGVHIPEKKLAKAIARYGQGSTLKRFERQWNKVNAFRSPTPEGISFITPAPSPSLDFSSPPSLEFSPLPWLGFREMISSQLKAQPRAFGDLGAIGIRALSAMDCQVPKAVLPSVPSLESTPETQNGPGLDRLALAAFVASNHILADWQNPITSRDRSLSLWHLKHEPLPWNFIDRLKSLASLQILKCCSSSKYEPTIEALYEVLFKEALESRNVALVKILLNCSKIDVNEFLPGGFSGLPLQVAVGSKDAPMTRLLLDRGAKTTPVRKADLDRVFSEPSRKPTEMSPTSQWPGMEFSDAPEGIRLAEAAEFNPALVKALLDDGADVNAPNVFGLTPLQLAANTSWVDLEVVDLLLKADADVDRRSRDNTFLSPTPLQIAIYKRKFHVAELLVRAGADVNAEPAWLNPESIDLGPYNHLVSKLDGHNALNIALYVTDDRECARLLLRNHAIPDDSTLAKLCEWDERGMIRQCFESGDTYSLESYVLIAAAKAGHLSMVQRSLDAGVDINLLSSCNETALTTSILSPDCSGDPGSLIPALLIENGADVNRPGAHPSALQAAIRKGKSHLIATLIRKGAPCDKSSLEEALRLKNLDVISALIENGAPYHELSLVQAVQTGNLNVVLKLIWNGARCDEEVLSCIVSSSISQKEDGNLKSRPLSRAMRKVFQQKRSEALEALLRFLETCLDVFLAESEFCAEFQTTCVGHPALFTAIKRRSHEHVNVLLRKGINLSSTCSTAALKQACYRGLDISLIKLLITAGVPVNIPETDETPCYWRTISGLSKISAQDWIGDNFQPLHMLARGGYDKAIQLLLDNGANPNLYGQGSSMHSPISVGKTKTVLSCAVRGGHLTTVRLLLRSGSDINQPATGPFGRTALQTAVELGDMDIIEELLQATADVNADPAKYGGVTALQAAAMKGYLGIATRLVNLEANVNAPAAKEEGRTALEGAAEHGRIDTVQFLLNSGADVLSPKFGAPQYNRAVQLARENGYNAVARLLERHRRGLD